MRKLYNTAHLCRTSDAGNMRCAIQRGVEDEIGDEREMKKKKNIILKIDFENKKEMASNLWVFLPSFPIHSSGKKLPLWLYKHGSTAVSMSFKHDWLVKV